MSPPPTHMQTFIGTNANLLPCRHCGFFPPGWQGLQALHTFAHTYDPAHWLAHRPTRPPPALCKLNCMHPAADGGPSRAGGGCRCFATHTRLNTQHHTRAHAATPGLEPSACTLLPTLSSCLPTFFVSKQMVPPAELVEGVGAPKPNPFERLFSSRSTRDFPLDRPEVDFADPRPYERQLFDQVRLI